MITPAPTNHQFRGFALAAVAIGALVIVAVVVAPRLARPKPSTANVATARITIDDNKFNPELLTVKKGTKVTWIVSGDDDDTYVIASNPHPSHTDLPGLLSPQIREGSTYTYIFDKTGTFGYHNDLIPTGNGTVKVVE
jgi:plastocyanin